MLAYVFNPAKAQALIGTYKDALELVGIHTNYLKNEEGNSCPQP